MFHSDDNLICELCLGSGLWKHAKSEGNDDYGLLVGEKARKYAIVRELDEVVSLKDGTVVLQYEVRLQNGLECGGAYLKYLRPRMSGGNPKNLIASLLTRLCLNQTNVG